MTAGMITAAIGLGALAVSLLGCAGTAVTPPSAVPYALQVAATQKLVLKAQATGAQVYECRAASDEVHRFQWTLKAPDADLYDDGGGRIGRHYAGPTWEATDGSTVVGEVKAKDNGPDPGAIPWLLLDAKATSGHGVFWGIQSVQRLNTVGGKAPAEGCDPS